MVSRLSFKSLALCFSLLALSGCAALTAATGSLLSRGVNANVQAGAENRQAIISQENAAPSVSIRPRANVGDIRQEQNATRAETIQNYNANPPIWVWLLLIVGWLLPSPSEMVRQVMSAFRGK
jgi:hypothetical protein